MKNQNGFTLIEIMVAVALLGLLSYFTTGILTNMSNSETKLQKQTLKALETDILSTTLKESFDKYAFQNLSVNLPSLGLNCPSVGLCVQQNRDINGKTNKSADLLTLVSKSKTIEKMYLANNYNALTKQLELVADVNSNKLKVNDWLVVTNINSSEMIKISTISKSGGKLVAHFNSNVLSAPYVEGDFVYLAIVSQMGFDPITNKVAIKRLDEKNISKYFSQVEQFKIGYISKAGSKWASSCSSFLFTKYTINMWNKLNQNANRGCYRVIDNIEIDFKGQRKIQFKVNSTN